MMRGKWAREEITGLLGISDRFLELSLKRHNGQEDGKGGAGLLEQLAEVRAKELKAPTMKQDEELFEKEWYLRYEEKVIAVKVFLKETDYSNERIAELVGVTVSQVKMNREWPNVKLEDQLEFLKEKDAGKYVDHLVQIRRKEGHQEGVQEALEKAVRSLLTRSEFTPGKIAELLEVPVSLVKKVKKRLCAK